MTDEIKAFNEYYLGLGPYNLTRTSKEEMKEDTLNQIKAVIDRLKPGQKITIERNKEGNEDITGLFTLILMMER